LVKSTNENTNDNTDDDIALRTEVERNSFWRRIQTSIMMIAALMISAGQWNSTKQIVVSTYQSIIANFTHTIEYDRIKQINVGNSLEFVKSKVGEPYVIKRSKIEPDVQYHYYSEVKYDLTLVSRDGQVAGYIVISKEDDFSPQIPFAETLGSLTLVQTNPDPKIYLVDDSNLLYFIDSKTLSKQEMFLTQIRGHVEYGANLASNSSSLAYTDEVNSAITVLIEKQTFSEDDTEILEKLSVIRSKIFPNFFAMTYLDSNFIAEALLTRYEYQFFTES
jgi:hypothetical protein